MRLGVCSVGLPDLTPDQAIPLAAQAGYAGIEWRVSPEVGGPGPAHFLTNNRCTVPPTDAAVRAVRERCAEAGLRIIGLNPYLEPGDLAGLEEMMRLAVIAGAAGVRLRAPRMGDAGFHRLVATATEYFTAAAELARRYEIKALLEMHQGTVCPSASLAVRVVGELPAEHVGVIYDAGNVVLEGSEDPSMALQILGPYLAHVHLKNAAFTRPPGGGVWRPEWTPLDDGVLDVPRVLDVLAAAGYQGWISVEDLSTDRPPADALRFNASFLSRHVACTGSAPAARAAV
ncbi:sugar phosphate isomerase/epimerase family protein [Actinoallomurus sp. CA-142502]|uniref:sugar phosphate isomerase/epimerase family protein n=1 Tax=Actinoallomurus sp. CA-142502 TaxID=3239885 RepID=UPI003D8A8400